MPVACTCNNLCVTRRLPPAEKTKIEMQNFSELQISNYTKERLALANFATPTPVQAAAIPQALEGKDVLATAQTGTGKTLAFLDSDHRAATHFKSEEYRSSRARSHS